MTAFVVTTLLAVKAVITTMVTIEMFRFVVTISMTTNVRMSV